MLKLLLATLLLALLTLTACPPGSAALTTSTPAATLITDATTDKARYAPDAVVRISVALKNPSFTATLKGTVRLTYWHLEIALGNSREKHFALAPGAARILKFSWQPPATDYQGYILEAQAQDETGHVLDTHGTAVDVASNWLKFPRYGFLTTYGDQPGNVSQDEVRQLKDFHLNGLQFYDWQYKHHQPLAGTVAAPAAAWPDLSSTPQYPKINYRHTILELIAAAHSYDMAAMNYNLLYGAWPDYTADGVDPRWGLWKNTVGTKQDAIPLPLNWQGNQLYLFNPGSVEWQNYLCRQEAQVLAAYPFDGWHLDQVGDRDTVYDYTGHPVNLTSTFAPFINNAKQRLGKTLIYNNVGAFGLAECAGHSTEDAAYVECWEWTGQKTYNDLKQVIDNSTQFSAGAKSTILAAYMNKTYATTRSAANPGLFNLPGLLLTDATIFASGGSHIELGDDTQMLCNEYFPYHALRLTGESRQALRRYYDFLVAYENLLQGGLSNSQNAIVLDRAANKDAAPQTIWSFAKSGQGYQVLHLINLTGEASKLWRDDNANYLVPAPQTDIAVKYYYGTTLPHGVYWASPDAPTAKATTLPFTLGTDKAGNFMRCVVPRLDYWDVVFMT